MAQDLITFAQKLQQILPAEDEQERLRQHLTIQDKVCCWYCGLPKDPEQDLFAESTLPICNQCVPDLIRKADATRLVLAKNGSGFKKELAELQKTSSPQFVNEVDKMLEGLNSNGLSLGDETARVFNEAAGNNLTPDELQASGIPDIKTAQRLLDIMWRSVAKRDEQLSGHNAYENLTHEELLGAALQSVADEMVVDSEFCRRAVELFLFRIVGFSDIVTNSESGVETTTFTALEGPDE